MSVGWCDEQGWTAATGTNSAGISSCVEQSVFGIGSALLFFLFFPWYFHYLRTKNLTLKDESVGQLVKNWSTESLDVNKGLGRNPNYIYSMLHDKHLRTKIVLSVVIGVIPLLNLIVLGSDSESVAMYGCGALYTSSILQSLASFISIHILLLENTYDMLNRQSKLILMWWVISLISEVVVVANSNALYFSSSNSSLVMISILNTIAVCAYISLVFLAALFKKDLKAEVAKSLFASSSNSMSYLPIANFDPQEQANQSEWKPKKRASLLKLSDEEEDDDDEKKEESTLNFSEIENGDNKEIILTHEHDQENKLYLLRSSEESTTGRKEDKRKHFLNRYPLLDNLAFAFCCCFYDNIKYGKPILSTKINENDDHCRKDKYDGTHKKEFRKTIDSIEEGIDVDYHNFDSVNESIDENAFDIFSSLSSIENSYDHSPSIFRRVCNFFYDIIVWIGISFCFLSPAMRRARSKNNVYNESCTDGDIFGNTNDMNKNSYIPPNSRGKEVNNILRQSHEEEELKEGTIEGSSIKVISTIEEEAASLTAIKNDARNNPYRHNYTVSIMNFLIAPCKKESNDKIEDVKKFLYGSTISDKLNLYKKYLANSNYEIVYEISVKVDDSKSFGKKKRKNNALNSKWKIYRSSRDFQTLYKAIVKRFGENKCISCGFNEPTIVPPYLYYSDIDGSSVSMENMKMFQDINIDLVKHDVMIETRQLASLLRSLVSNNLFCYELHEFMTENKLIDDAQNTLSTLLDSSLSGIYDITLKGKGIIRSSQDGMRSLSSKCKEAEIVGNDQNEISNPTSSSSQADDNDSISTTDERRKAKSDIVNSSGIKRNKDESFEYDYELSLRKLAFRLRREMPLSKKIKRNANNLPTSKIDHTIRLRTFCDVCSGSDIYRWLMNTNEIKIGTRQAAIDIGKALVKRGYIIPVVTGYRGQCSVYQQDADEIIDSHGMYENFRFLQEKTFTETVENDSILFTDSRLWLYRYEDGKPLTSSIFKEDHPGNVSLFSSDVEIAIVKWKETTDYYIKDTAGKSNDGSTGGIEKKIASITTRESLRASFTISEDGKINSLPPSPSSSTAARDVPIDLVNNSYIQNIDDMQEETETGSHKKSDNLYNNATSEVYISYEIVISTREEMWALWKRYSEFSILHKRLKRLGVIPPVSLPPKRIFSFTSNNDEKFLSERKEALQNYLQGVIRLTATYPNKLGRLMMSFLDPDAYSLRIGTLNQLQVVHHDPDTNILSNLPSFIISNGYSNKDFTHEDNILARDSKYDIFTAMQDEEDEQAEEKLIESQEIAEYDRIASALGGF